MVWLLEHYIIYIFAVHSTAAVVQAPTDLSHRYCGIKSRLLFGPPKEQEFPVPTHRQVKDRLFWVWFLTIFRTSSILLYCHCTATYSPARGGAWKFVLWHTLSTLLTRTRMQVL